MSTNLQRSNSRVMYQKVEKAQRLLEEVRDSVNVRGRPHPLWDEVLVNVESAFVACERTLGTLEAVAVHNKQVEAQKI